MPYIIIAMRITLEIIEDRGRKHFRTYDDIDIRNEGLAGQGWTISDAVEDFLGAYNNDSFYDDETPAALRREDIELKRVKIFSQRL